MEKGKITAAIFLNRMAFPDNRIKNLDQEAILHENEGSFKTITRFSLARFRNFNLFYYSQRIGKAKLFIIAQNRLNAMILVTLNMK